MHCIRIANKMSSALKGGIAKTEEVMTDFVLQSSLPLLFSFSLRFDSGFTAIMWKGLKVKLPVGRHTRKKVDAGVPNVSFKLYESLYVVFRAF